MLASTSIVLGLGVLNYASGDHSKDLQSLILYGSTSQQLNFFKFVSLFLLLMAGFFSFTLCVRYINHATFLMTLPVKDRELHALKFNLQVNPTITTLLLNRYDCNYAGFFFTVSGFAFYTIGMRCYYIVIPTICWLFGPFTMFAATLLLIVVLVFLDHARLSSFDISFWKKKKQRFIEAPDAEEMDENNKP